MSPQNNSIYRFGVFEFDLRAAELRKSGVKVRLQDQPCQVLLKLLEHPGEVVSREELHSKLWNEDTFVDFETGLNTAVKRLRETLGDSADNPIFIETLPRRGYKFIAPVEIPARQDSTIPAAVDHQERPRRKDLLKRGWVVAAMAMLLVICAAIWRSQPRTPTVANAVRVSNDGKPKIPMNLFVTDGVSPLFYRRRALDVRLWDYSNVGLGGRNHSNYYYASAGSGDVCHLAGSLGVVGRERRRLQHGSCNRTLRGRSGTLGATITGGCALPCRKHLRVRCLLDPGWTAYPLREWARDKACEQRRERAADTGEGSHYSSWNSVLAGWSAYPLLR